MLTCKDVSKLYSESLELDQLPLLKKAQIKLHLSICKNCERYVKIIRMIPKAFQKNEPISQKDQIQPLIEMIKKKIPKKE